MEPRLNGKLLIQERFTHSQSRYRIIELLRLEKTLKIIKSNHNLTILP